MNEEVAVAYMDSPEISPEEALRFKLASLPMVHRWVVIQIFKELETNNFPPAAIFDALLHNIWFGYGVPHLQSTMVVVVLKLPGGMRRTVASARIYPPSGGELMPLDDDDIEYVLQNYNGVMRVKYNYDDLETPNQLGEDGMAMPV